MSNKKNNSFQKWAKCFNTHFTKDTLATRKNAHQRNAHENQCDTSSLLAQQELQKQKMPGLWSTGTLVQRCWGCEWCQHFEEFKVKH